MSDNQSHTNKVKSRAYYAGEEPDRLFDSVIKAQFEPWVCAVCTRP
jgi:hypothetical protein